MSCKNKVDNTKRYGLSFGGNVENNHFTYDIAWDENYQILSIILRCYSKYGFNGGYELTTKTDGLIVNGEYFPYKDIDKPVIILFYAETKESVLQVCKIDELLSQERIEQLINVRDEARIDIQKGSHQNRINISLNENTYQLIKQVISELDKSKLEIIGK